MPSTNGGTNDERQTAAGRSLEQELRAIPLADSLRSQIRHLTLRRQESYVEARAHRVGGHLVPGSLGLEMAENALHLRYALKRYAEATAEIPATVAGMHATTVVRADRTRSRREARIS